MLYRTALAFTLPLLLCTSAALAQAQPPAGVVPSEETPQSSASQATDVTVSPVENDLGTAAAGGISYSHSLEFARWCALASRTPGFSTTAFDVGPGFYAVGPDYYSAIPRYINRGNEIVRSDRGRPTPPPNEPAPGHVGASEAARRSQQHVAEAPREPRAWDNPSYRPPSAEHRAGRGNDHAFAGPAGQLPLTSNRITAPAAQPAVATHPMSVPPGNRPPSPAPAVIAPAVTAPSPHVDTRAGAMAARHGGR